MSSGSGSSTSGVSCYVTSDGYKHFQVMSVSTLIGRVVCLGLYNINTWPTVGQGLESFYYSREPLPINHFVIISNNSIIAFCGDTIITITDRLQHEQDSRLSHDPITIEQCG